MRVPVPIEKFKAELLKLHRENILSLILFGSVARNEAIETSDIDLLVIAKSDKLKVMEDATSIAFSQLLKYKRYISVKVFEETHFNSLIKLKSPLIKNVLKEGIVLYGKRMG